MPKSIATAVAPLPRHNDKPPYPHPLGEPQSLTFSLNTIRQLDGLYCLNDLHKMAGGSKKDTPSRFIRLARTKGQIQAFEKMEFAKNQKMGSATHNPYMGSESQNQKMGSDNSPVIRVINGGDMQGVYACKPLMFAYTAWLDDDFHALVYNVFDRVATATKPLTLSETFHQKTADLKAVIDYLHECGSGLATHGKKTKPRLMRELQELLNHIQPQLPFIGENN